MVMKWVKREKQTECEGCSGLTKCQPFIHSAWLILENVDRRRRGERKRKGEQKRHWRISLPRAEVQSMGDPLHWASDSIS